MRHTSLSQTPSLSHPAASRPALPTPSRSRDGARWNLRWRKLRDVILPPEERVVRAARRGRPVILGTAAEPWETLPERRRLLSCLEGFRGLRLRLTCRNDRVLDDAEILAWLDRDHAVRVEFRLDAGRFVRQGFHSPYVERLCAAVRRLSAAGLEVRLVVEVDAAEVPTTPDRELRRELRRLAGELSDAAAADLLLAGDAPPAWHRAVEPLRLSHGFAGSSGRAALPGRG